MSETIIMHKSTTKNKMVKMDNIDNHTRWTDHVYWNKLVTEKTGINCPDDWQYWIGNLNLELGLPWITPGAIIRLQELLKKDFHVVEFGCGGSTIFFANRRNFVISYESDPEFYEKVNTLLLQNELNHVHLSLLTTREDYVNVIAGIPDKTIDCVLIDSAIPGLIGRAEIGRLFLPKLKQSGFMIMDNYFHACHIVEELVFAGWIQEDYNDIHWHGVGTRFTFQQ